MGPPSLWMGLAAVVVASFVAILLPTATHGFTTTTTTPPFVLRLLLPQHDQHCNHLSPFNKKPSANAARRRRSRRRHQDHGSAERATHLIHNSQNKKEEEPPLLPRRPSWMTTTMTTTKSPLDAALTWLISDTGSVLLGGIGLVALVVSQWWWSSDDNDVATTESVTALTRATLLAVMAIGAVLLNGLSQLDVATALAETVQLEGEFIPVTQFVHVNKSSCTTTTTESATTDDVTAITAWVLEALVQATPASSAVYLQRRFDNDDELSSSGWQIVGYVGILPPDLVQSPAVSFTLPAQTPILDRFIISKKKKNTTNTNNKVTAAVETTMVLAAQGESYLPTLQALPGKVEFTYLPRNTQAVLVLSPPPSPTTIASCSGAAELVVLGANRARSFTPRDIAWCQAAVSQLVVAGRTTTTTTTK
jgi:Cofactor assembly of complex C subunit B, CCB2/CCB4